MYGGKGGIFVAQDQRWSMGQDASDGNIMKRN